MKVVKTRHWVKPYGALGVPFVGWLLVKEGSLDEVVRRLHQYPHVCLIQVITLEHGEWTQGPDEASTRVSRSTYRTLFREKDNPDLWVEVDSRDLEELPGVIPEGDREMMG